MNDLGLPDATTTARGRSRSTCSIARSRSAHTCLASVLTDLPGTSNRIVAIRSASVVTRTVGSICAASLHQFNREVATPRRTDAKDEQEIDLRVRPSRRRAFAVAFHSD